MKKIISTLLFLVISTVFVWAQGTAQIYFEKTTRFILKRQPMTSVYFMKTIRK